MVVQPRGAELLRCYAQNDHAIASGALADAWVGAGGTDAVSFVVKLAIGLHDVGWIDEDRSPRLDPRRHRPFDFQSLPVAQRLPIYRRGIDTLEALHPYAGHLASVHFSGFIDPSRDSEFAEHEQARRRRLEKTLRIDDARVASDYSLLQALDLLSLVLCIAQPGADPASFPRWIGETMKADGVVYRLEWEGDSTLVVSPTPFARPVVLELPFREISTSDCSSQASLDEAWAAAPVELARLTVR